MGNGTRDQTDSVAIVGMASRLPGQISSSEELWDLLDQGRELAGPVPASRLGAARDLGVRVAAEPPGVYFEAEELTGLDLDFFGLSPREAAAIEPQHRLLMELTWEAIEDAGFVAEPSALSVGVYVGIWNVDDPEGLAPGPLDLYGIMGRSRHAASGRLSYLFGFDGPSLTIDSACSSSLVALHLAATAIRAGECDVAVVGAANVILDDRITGAFAEAGMLAPDGRCRFGDEAADGFVRAEGAAALVLRRYDRALAEDDRIHAVLEGSAISNDGRTTRHLVTPGAPGQRRAAELAMERAGAVSADLTYVEAHGTGTAGGDAAELTALADALVGARSPCPVGSIKSNLGHTESAAGLFGVIKAALMFRHRTIPPTLNVERPTPEIAWDTAPIRLAVDPEPMPTGDDVRIGVANFGLSGTNAHVVLAPPPAPTRAPAFQPADQDAVPVPLLPISARSKAALAARAAQLADLIEDDPDRLPAIAATSRSRRTHLTHRAVVIGHRPGPVVVALRAAAGGQADPNLLTGRVAAAVPSEAAEPARSTGAEPGDDATGHRRIAERFVTGQPVVWTDRSAPVDLPPYPWQRRRAWPVGSPGEAVTVGDVDRDPGRRLPAMAHRPDEHVWERSWSTPSLAALLADPDGPADLAVNAASALQQVAWSATVVEADASALDPKPRSTPSLRHRTQLLVVNGPDARFELFLAAGAGWTAVASGSLDRLDGYPLPAPVGDAIDRLAPARRHRWLAKRVGEQVAISLGRPPASAIAPTAPLVDLGVDDRLARTVGARLAALVDDRRAATAVDGAATVESITKQILAGRTIDDAAIRAAPTADTIPGPTAEPNPAVTNRLADELAALLDGPDHSAGR